MVAPFLGPILSITPVLHFKKVVSDDSGVPADIITVYEYNNGNRGRLLPAGTPFPNVPFYVVWVEIKKDDAFDQYVVSMERAFPRARISYYPM